jgi:hypothetical protein
MTTNSFYNLLFRPGELTCFAKSVTDTKLSSALNPRSDANWFSINPLHTSRADANVQKYRNFLIEIDNMPIEQQQDYVLSRVPVSAIVFSGNKSYHFIISLVDDLPNEAEYRKVAEAIYNAVPGIDKSCKNPSRLSRTPGVLRPDTGLYQDLIYVGKPIVKAELPTLSNSSAEKIVASGNSHSKVFVTQQINRVLEIGVDNYVANHFSGRNQFFYWLGKRLSELELGKDTKKLLVDKFYDRLENKRSFSKREAYAAARIKY